MSSRATVSQVNTGPLEPTPKMLKMLIFHEKEKYKKSYIGPIKFQHFQHLAKWAGPRRCVNVGKPLQDKAFEVLLYQPGGRGASNLYGYCLQDRHPPSREFSHNSIRGVPPERPKHLKPLAGVSFGAF